MRRQDGRSQKIGHRFAYFRPQSDPAPKIEGLLFNCVELASGSNCKSAWLGRGRMRITLPDRLQVLGKEHMRHYEQSLIYS